MLSSDELLLDEISKGSHSAFADLVNRHTDKFYRLAYRMVFNKEDAEEVVQEAFLKIWQDPQKWDKTKNIKFTTWFYKVVVNLSLDHQKKKRLELMDQFSDIDATKGSLDNTEERLDQELKQKLIDKYIFELPERQQIALNLCFYEELKNKEAAEIMGVGLKALESLLMRAKATLKNNISQHLEREKKYGEA